MRLYLDTNILVFLTRRTRSDISNDVNLLLLDYSNQLMTSTVCVHELIHLFQIGKIHPRKDDSLTQIDNFPRWLSNMNIEIVPVSKQHLLTLTSLPIIGEHRDPNDRLIIAQAISDRISLVSSDRKFSYYTKYGLDFVFNER